jgi:hypothetical protein
LALALSDRRMTLYQLAFVVELPLLVFVMADPGSDFNHLIDITVLTVIVVGELWVRTAGRGRELSTIGIAISVALMLGAADVYRQSLKSDVRDAAGILAGKESTKYPTDPLAGYVSKKDSLLSEDPAVPLLMGERPLFVDAVSLRRLGLNHPSWIDDLRRRVAAKRFEKVILVHPIEDSHWYGERNFGPQVRDAIRRAYRLDARVARQPLTYWVYVPRTS